MCWSHNIFLLESDTAAGNNIETADAIDTSLTKFDSSIDDVLKEIMSGLCTDAGKGGTREGLAN